jgi:hypothetical protein
MYIIRPSTVFFPGAHGSYFLGGVAGPDLVLFVLFRTLDPGSRILKKSVSGKNITDHIIGLKIL